MTTSSAVSFRGLGKSFADKNGAPVTALENITFDVPEGQIFGVVGTSGAGKSTLLRMINGLEKPTAGVVETLGNDMSAMSLKGLRELRREVSMVFQHFNLVGSKTVAENVAMPLILSKVPKAQITQRVTEVLELVGLADRADHKPSQLSGGQRQRVGIARSLVTNPKVLLCDEPTSALDPLTTSQILELLVSINESLNLTIVIITHQMDVISRIADSVAVLEDGKLLEIGPVEEIFAQPQELLTRRFVNTVIPQEPPEDLGPHAIRVVYSHGAARTLLQDLNAQGLKAQLAAATDAKLRRTSVGAMVLELDSEADAQRALGALAGAEHLDATLVKGATRG